MCGRIASYDRQALHDFVYSTVPQLRNRNQELWEDWQPRYNLAPTEPVAVLYQSEEPDTSLMTWGFTPRFWKQGTPSKPLFNARSDSIWEKANFRGRIGHQHCMVLMNGFYEWHGRKEPWYIRKADGQAMAMAGIWQEGPEGLECCIITTEANGMMGRIHHRMPVIVDVEGARGWLQAQDREETKALMTPCQDDWLEAWRVSTYVNNTRHEGPECLEEGKDRG